MDRSDAIALRPCEENDENVELAQRSFAAFNRTVAEGADDYYDLLDAEVEWIPITALLDGRSYRGPEAVRRWVGDLKRDWELYEIRWKQVRDLGDGRVLVFGVWHTRGRRGGVQLSFEQAAWLIDLRCGKLIRSETYRPEQGPRSRRATRIGIGRTPFASRTRSTRVTRDPSLPVPRGRCVHGGGISGLHED